MAPDRQTIPGHNDRRVRRWSCVLAITIHVAGVMLILNFVEAVAGGRRVRYLELGVHEDI